MTRAQLLGLCKVASAPARHRGLTASRARRVALCSLHHATRQALLRDAFLQWISTDDAVPFQAVILTALGWGALIAARALRADPYTGRARKGER